jgi:undecaprenyl-diphosphatase
MATGRGGDEATDPGPSPHLRRGAVRRTLRLLLGGARFELSVLILLLLGAASAWGFVAVADEVLEGEIHAWDERILLAMRSASDPADPLGPHWLEELMRDVTGFGGVAAVTGLTLLVAGFLLLDGRRALALLVVLAVASGVLVSSLLKLGFERPRPDLVPHGSYVSTSSFPSGHSMMAAIAYLTLGALLARAEARKRLKVFVLAAAFLLTTAVGVSRVYLGVHWPSDVLAGWAAGSFWAAVCWLVAWRLQVLGAAEPEQ